MKSGDIAKKIFWVLVTFFVFLEYFSAFRPYIQNEYGIYVLGFVDGGVAVAILLVILFYVESYFEKEPNVEAEPSRMPIPQKKIAQTKIIKRKKVKSEVIEEMIQKAEKIRDIVDGVQQRAGDSFMAKYITFDPLEEKEFKKNLNWLAENYPKIGEEMNRATRMEYVDPVRRIRVKNYDPLLQILHYSSLKSVYENSFQAREFRNNLDSGITRLRAYLGLIREK